MTKREEEEENITDNFKLTLDVETEVMNHLFSLVEYENVKHKIVEVSNLINEELYKYIIQENIEENAVEEEVNKIDTKVQEKTNKTKNETMNVLTSNGLLQNKVHIKHTDVFENFCYWEELKKSIELSQSFNIYYKQKIQNEKKQTEQQMNKILFLCYDGYNQYDTNCNLCADNKQNHIWHNKMKNPLYNDTSSYFRKYFFVLGSTSISRKHILETNNIYFLTVPIKIDETRIGCRQKNDPLTLTANISIGKAIKLLYIIKKDKELQKHIIEMSAGRKIILLVGDEVIYCNNSIYEKPKDVTEAVKFLNAYRNNKCYSYCSLSLIDFETEKFITGIDETVLNMSGFHKDSINIILKDPSIFWCAGALKIENEEMSKYVQSIKGSVDSIFGLSINLLVHLVNLL